MVVKLQGPRSCGSLFLDSGAHSLYIKEVMDKKNGRGYKFFKSREFKKFVDDYARFIKKHTTGIDLYVNVDVIHDPEVSWKVLKYLENHHGLKPLPVIHSFTPLEWVHKHIDAGYDYVGIGGLGQDTTKWNYFSWADRVFDIICPAPGRLPIIKTHGFAMTSYELLLRYPWYSVDSSSWCKAAGYAFIFVPHKRNGSFTFEENPYRLFMSSNAADVDLYQARHYISLSKMKQREVRDWLREIKMPMGKCDDAGNSVEYGVISEYHARAVANLRFFERMIAWMPKYPTPFTIGVQHGFFSDL